MRMRTVFDVSRYVPGPDGAPARPVDASVRGLPPAASAQSFTANVLNAVAMTCWHSLPDQLSALQVIMMA